jgi:gamma-glutamylaminecyclotransferase
VTEALRHMPMLFVYGSLKEGFPNFHVNQGRRVHGEFRTVQTYPLYLIAGRLPCLLNAPGEGLHVQGQLFEVSPKALERMDALERVGQPGGYLREPIAVQRIAAPESAPLSAFVYLQSRAMLDTAGTHLGPLELYTVEHARSLRW